MSQRLLQDSPLNEVLTRIERRSEVDWANVALRAGISIKPTSTTTFVRSPASARRTTFASASPLHVVAAER